jgi:DNA replication initiation complex subunit (GINS family)
MGGNEIKITYDTLFEILRREKDRKELQKLDDNFFADVSAYFKEKNDILDKIDDYSEEEADRIKTQIHNARRLVRELYNTREKKIVEKAIIKARTKSDIITTENMLADEKKLFEKLVGVLSNFRSDTLTQLLKGNKTAVKKVVEKKVEERVMVRFLAQIPEFVGIDGNTYGPFSIDEISVLPKKIADILVNTEKAEIINEEDS